MGFEVIEYPSARMDDDTLYHNPKIRADDLNNAFADPVVKAIICSIGGEDSIRILPYLDKNVISKNPKIFMGYSDNTTLLTFINMCNIVSFHGPTIMSGFSQMKSFPEEYKKHVYTMLTSIQNSYAYQNYGLYSDGYLDWSLIENCGKVKTTQIDGGMIVLQGKGEVQGRLVGGCFDVIEWMKGTSYYPNLSHFDGSLFLLETSEEKPSIETVRRALRNYGVQGVLNSISGLLFGRLRDYSDLEKKEFYEMVKDVVNNEFSLYELPIVVNMDFGHTDPQWVLPLGIKSTLNLDKMTFGLSENWLID
jgi:muramoyltetrapeptide carboxypeptidase LdcA involved in peptidoglycan recycling